METPGESSLSRRRGQKQELKGPASQVPEEPLVLPLSTPPRRARFPRLDREPDCKPLGARAPSVFSFASATLQRALPTEGDPSTPSLGC